MASDDELSPRAEQSDPILLPQCGPLWVTAATVVPTLPTRLGWSPGMVKQQLSEFMQNTGDVLGDETALPTTMVLILLLVSVLKRVSLALTLPQA